MAFFSSLQSSLVSLLPFIILMNFFRIIWVSFHSKKKQNFLPSPRKLPIIGNFHQLGSSPNRSLQILSRKYGPIMLLHLGSAPTLVASSAEAARDIMKTHDLSFASRPSLSIPNILLYGSKDIALSNGEYWRQMRGTVVVHLLSTTRVRLFKHVREEEIQRMVGLLEESCGSVVNLGSFLASLTNNIICRAVLGRTIGVELIDLLRRFMDIFSVLSVGSYIPWLSWLDRLSGLEGNAKKLAKEFDEYLENIIEEHLNKKSSVVAANEGQDLLGILLDIQRDNTIDFNITRDSIKAVILDLFLGGTDTTLVILQWTVAELIKHPRVMKKLQKEVTQIAQGKSIILEENLEKMQYLKAVIKESMRLHPPLPFLNPRQSKADVKLNGHDIPAGTHVIINAWAIGRDPEKWIEPEEFNPERFLNNSIDYNSPNFEWILFGAGRRRCPGIQFGMVIVELALANLVNKFDFALPNGFKSEDLDMSEKFGIALHMKSSLMVVANMRL